MKNNQPEKVFRLGQVSVSVFVNVVVNDGDERMFRSVSLQKRYTADGENRFGTSFTRSELPLAAELLGAAFTHIASMELSDSVGRDWHGIVARTFQSTGSDDAEVKGGAK